MRVVSCPQCKKEAVFSKENPFRPFCSERCKLIDLGEWASEGYAIPEQEKTILNEDDEFEPEEKILN
jgi:endogenous inhibitor of DNA gyrase (YacG/DUF329 family)